MHESHQTSYAQRTARPRIVRSLVLQHAPRRGLRRTCGSPDWCGNSLTEIINWTGHQGLLGSMGYAGNDHAWHSDGSSKISQRTQLSVEALRVKNYWREAIVMIGSDIHA